MPFMRLNSLLVASLAFSAVAVMFAARPAVGANQPDKPASVAPTKVVAKPTYAEHIAPILNKSCVSCHREGEVAPFSLMGYQNAKKWANMASSVTQSKRMPPWKAVEGYGEFLDESRLAPAEIQLIKNWAETGAPRGDAKREPKPPVFSGGAWTLGKPDMILSASKPFKLAAEGEDVYRNFVVRTDSKEPLYVNAVDVKPGNAKVVHHVIVFLDPRKSSEQLLKQTKDGQDGYESGEGGVGFLPGGSLGGWAPGIRPRFLPAGTAFKVEPGSNVVLQVHYHRSGKDEEDLTKVGLYLSKEPPKKSMDMAWVFNFRVNIPANEPNYRINQTYPIPAPVTVYGAMPHMHLLGKEMKAWFELPDGTKKPLVFVDDWDFNWQLNYSLAQPMKIPAGSKLRVEARYDNSSANPRNPNNPPKRVTWGEQTTDEMFLLIAYYTVD